MAFFSEEFSAVVGSAVTASMYGEDAAERQTVTKKAPARRSFMDYLKITRPASFR